MFNYHTHTVFCGHAKNTVEEMVEEAIKKGFSSIGFSEHFDRNTREKYEFPYNPKEYFDTVKEAKEKYSDKIEVLGGAEMDFYLYNYLDVYEEIKSYKPDYILGSVHRIKDFSFSLGHVPFIYKSNEEIEYIIKEYLGIIIAMINSGCVNSVSHFDIFKRSYILPNEEIYYGFYEEIVKALKKNNVALELNTHYNEGEFKYIQDENLYIWKLAKDYNIPIIISSDCHSKEDLDYKFDLAYKLLKKVGIKTTCKFKNMEMIPIEIKENK